MIFYATVDADSIRSYMPDVPYLLPASSWARYNLRTPKLPSHIKEKAADCGGFVATKVWGSYRYTPGQYTAWLASWSPSWAATMDYCCEDEITAGRPGLVRQRQEKTTRMARYFFRHFPGASWCWVPTVQGWRVEDYRSHALQLRPLLKRMADHYGSRSSFRVGIGTLCRRASPTMIHQVVKMVSEILPGYPLHLWGVKLTLLRHSTSLRANVGSIDSAAWNGRFGKGIEEYRRSGLSQREYAFKVALPAYLAKVGSALAPPPPIGPPRMS
jgi:hypothetical protein